MPALSPLSRFSLEYLPSWQVEAENWCELPVGDFLGRLPLSTNWLRCEAKGHHPDIDIRYNRVRLVW